MTESKVCFDKFVISRDSAIDSLKSDPINENVHRTCNYFRNQLQINGTTFPSDTNDNIPTFYDGNVNEISAADGCCPLNINEIKTTANTVKNKAEIAGHLDKLKLAYKRKFNEIKGFIEKIIPVYNIADGSTTELTQLDNKLIDFYKVFLSAQNDDEKIQKLLETVRNVNPNTDTTTLAREYEKLTEFRDNGAKQQKVEYFDENQYALYECVFYTMLVIVSILFVRTQFKK